MVEIELLNGTRVILPRDWNKVRAPHEKMKTSFKFTKHFPYIHIERKRYVVFWFRTHYETLDDDFDPKFEANCTLLQLAHIFGINAKSFEQVLIEEEIQNPV